MLESMSEKLYISICLSLYQTMLIVLLETILSQVVT